MVYLRIISSTTINLRMYACDQLFATNANANDWILYCIVSWFRRKLSYMMIVWNIFFADSGNRLHLTGINSSILRWWCILVFFSIIRYTLKRYIDTLLVYTLWYEFWNDFDAQNDFIKFVVTKKLVLCNHSYLNRYALAIF